MNKILLLTIVLFSLLSCKGGSTNPDEPCTVLGKTYTNADTAVGVANVKLDRFPTCVCYLENIKYLAFSSNDLKSIPELIVNLKKLIFFSIIGNPITELPDNFGQVSNLLTFWGFNTQLKTLPASFGNLQYLEDLNLNHTNIEVFPECITNLISLKSLNLNNTPLQHIPESIKNLKDHLEMLEIMDTKISKEEFDQLKLWLPKTLIFYK